MLKYIALFFNKAELIKRKVLSIQATNGNLQCLLCSIVSFLTLTQILLNFEKSLNSFLIFVEIKELLMFINQNDNCVWFLSF